VAAGLIHTWVSGGPGLISACAFELVEKRPHHLRVAARFRGETALPSSQRRCFSTRGSRPARDGEGEHRWVIEA